MNWLSVKIEDLKSAADTGIASQSVVMSIASDLLFLYQRAQEMAAIPEQPLEDGHIQMIINSHEKGWAMIIPCQIEYPLAKEIQALRRAANPVTRDEDVAWWKQEAEDCKARLLELARENGDLKRRQPVALADAVAKFKEWNIGFPVERFKADYVIGWMLFHYPPLAPQTDRKLLRELVDVVWNDATESTEVPTTQRADELISKVLDAERNNHPNAPGVPENHQHLNELYHAQEKRLFKLAQRIKGPSFDKYAHSPSQAIDVLETAILGQKPTNGKSELLQRAEKLAEDTAALARRVDTSACTWRYDDEEHSWDGECGASWTFLEDGPKENSMHFCPGCGKPVAIQSD